MFNNLYNFILNNAILKFYLKNYQYNTYIFFSMYNKIINLKIKYNKCQGRSKAIVINIKI